MPGCVTISLLYENGADVLAGHDDLSTVRAHGRGPAAQKLPTGASGSSPPAPAAPLSIPAATPRPLRTGNPWHGVSGLKLEPTLYEWEFLDVAGHGGPDGLSLKHRRRISAIPAPFCVRHHGDSDGPTPSVFGACRRNWEPGTGGRIWGLTRNPPQAQAPTSKPQASPKPLTVSACVPASGDRVVRSRPSPRSRPSRISRLPRSAAAR